jgi:AcrR family transcriptional regulator
MLKCPEQHEAAGRPGRPRAFDADWALDVALEMFLDRGYHETSLSALTAALDIARPSLYACFGNKEALYRQAIELYLRRHMILLREALAEPTLRKTVERLLRSTLANPKLAGGLAGFAGLLSAMPAETEFDELREQILVRQATFLRVLEARFAEAQNSGEMSSRVVPDALAFLLEALAHGLFDRAKGGASADELDRLVSVALAALEGVWGRAVPDAGAWGGENIVL